MIVIWILIKPNIFLIGDTIFISLNSLNSTNNVYKSYQTLQRSANIAIEDIPYDFGYLIIQVHSFKQPVSLWNTNDFDPQAYVNGTNIGLVYIVAADDIPQYYLSTQTDVNMTILLVIIGHDLKGKWFLICIFILPFVFDKKMV